MILLVMEILEEVNGSLQSICITLFTEIHNDIIIQIVYHYFNVNSNVVTTNNFLELIFEIQLLQISHFINPAIFLL